MQVPQISNARKVFRFKGGSVNPLGSDIFFRNKGLVPLLRKRTFEENAWEFYKGFFLKPLKYKEGFFEIENRGWNMRKKQRAFFSKNGIRKTKWLLISERKIRIDFWE